MILALAGYSKVGKDTLCDQLQNFTQVAFADVLKQEVTMMLKAVGIEVDLWGADKEEWRDTLVHWGRKRRSMDRDYWIKQLYLRHAETLNKGRACITDMRFLNEQRWVKSHDGLIIGIERPGYGPANEEEAFSIRELRIQCPEIPWIINDGTPRDLELQARSILKEYWARRTSNSVIDN